MTDGQRAGGFGEANTSFWLESVPRSAREGHERSAVRAAYDVAIVGGGFGGLWTAYHLNRTHPELSIAIFEARHVAHGASGRNGGWVLGLLTHQAQMLADRSAEEQATARSLIAGTVDEIGLAIREHGIDCGFHKGGMLRIAARHPYQLQGLEKYRRQMRGEGGPGCYTDLDAQSAAGLVGMRDVMGGSFYPHCAVVNPAQLAFGLASVLRSRGVEVHENTAVLRIEPNAVTTERGTCSAAHIVLATEAYSSTLEALDTRILSVYSHVIATEPLSQKLRESIGLRDRQAFSDTSGSYTYGQITADGRMVLGALSDYPRGGTPGGVTATRRERRQQRVHAIMLDVFPQLAGVAIDAAWSGPLGVPRDWSPTVVHEEGGRFTFVGGYSGRGVAAAHLFGRTAAEMITATDGPLSNMPWTRRVGRCADGLARWEGEALRWLGATMALRPGEFKDRVVMSRMPRPAKALGLALFSLFPPAL